MDRELPNKIESMTYICIIIENISLSYVCQVSVMFLSHKLKELGHQETILDV